MTLNIIPTEDGSITCRDQTTGELYHNRAGAYTEALFNYVEPSDLKGCLSRSQQLNVLDVCFGLGYNTFVLIQELLRLLPESSIVDEFHLKVTAIDCNPDIINILSQVLEDKRLAGAAPLGEDLEKYQRQMNSQPCPQHFSCHRLFGPNGVVHLELMLKFVDLRREIPRLAGQGQRFDLIYHDGFSPKQLPELWTYDLFNRYTYLLADEGKLLTYSSAAAVRGALRLCGLTVMRTRAVGGKSGGTIAGRLGELLKNQYALPLSDLEESRLILRSAIPYRDPTLSDSRQTIVSRRLNEMHSSSLSSFKT